MIVEMQLSSEGEESKFVSLQHWEIDYISYSPGNPYNAVHLRTVDNVSYYPIQIDFKHDDGS